MHKRERILGDGPVQYVLEHRGGWDEWSDTYWAVTAVILPDGREVNRFRDAIDHYGHEVSIEFPSRRHGPHADISVEWSNPYIVREFSSLSSFNEWAEDHIDRFK